MTYSGSRLWPNVTSPVARRALVYLFNLPGSYTDGDFLESIVRIEDENAMHGLCELWARIQGSDVARQIACGPALAPDISDSMTGYKRMLYRVFRPRTLEQQLEGYIINLRWYISPSTETPLLHNPYHRMFKGMGFSTVILLYLLMRFLPGYQSYIQQTISTILSTTALLAAIIILLKVSLAKSPKYDMQATVLYHYLRREYGDKEE